jgi:hypothetical protein
MGAQERYVADEKAEFLIRRSEFAVFGRVCSGVRLESIGHRPLQVGAKGGSLAGGILATLHKMCEHLIAKHPSSRCQPYPLLITLDQSLCTELVER